MKKRFLFLFLLYLFSLPQEVFCTREDEIKIALNQMEAEFFAKAYIKNLRERIKEEKEKVPMEKPGFTLRQKGILRNETVYRVSNKREFTKIKNQLILAETGKFLDSLRKTEWGTLLKE